MDYETAMRNVIQFPGGVTRQAWVDDDLCKNVHYGYGKYFVEYYDIGERAGYKPTPEDLRATDWRWGK